DTYEVEPPKPVIIVTIGGKELKMPILAIPGMHPNVIAIAVGYGRNEKSGIASHGVGQNMYPFVNGTGATREYYQTNVEYKGTDEKFPIAYTQSHNQYEGRKEVVREFSIGDFTKEPELIPEYRKELEEEFGGSSSRAARSFRAGGTLY